MASKGASPRRWDAQGNPAQETELEQLRVAQGYYDELTPAEEAELEHLRATQGGPSQEEIDAEYQRRGLGPAAPTWDAPAGGDGLPGDGRTCRESLLFAAAFAFGLVGRALRYMFSAE